MVNEIEVQNETTQTISNHFYIEITEQNKDFVFQAGQFKLDRNGNFKKHILADNATTWASFWTIFQEAYHNKALKNKADVLFYIHGLWSGNEFQLNKTLRHSNDFYTQNPDSPIALTLSLIWHTDYRFYTHTRQLCQYRAKFFALNFWAKVIKIKGFLIETALGGKPHLLCHSMGNYFLENMLPSIPLHKDPLFQEFIMAAADVEDDFFEKQEAAIARLSHRTLIINNSKDRSLSISKWLNRHARLGKHPPQYFRDKYASVYATEVGRVGDVKTILGSINQHQHHQVSKQVVLYLCRVFRGERTLEVLDNKH